MLSLVRMPGKWCVQLIAVICPLPPQLPGLVFLASTYFQKFYREEREREREGERARSSVDYTRGTRFYLSSVCLCVCLSVPPSPPFVFASVRRVCRRHLLFGLASRLQMGTKVDCAWNWAVCMCVPVPVIADMLVPSTLISLPSSSLYSSSCAWELVIIN